MEKSLILYKSKSGFSKEYAFLLKDMIYSDIYDIDDFNRELSSYIKIFFFSGLYATGINRLKKFKKLFSNYKNDIHVIVVGATPGSEEDIINIKNSNFNNEELNKYIFHYFRGGFNFKKCKNFDKILMLLLKFKLKMKKNKTPDEIGMLNAYKHPLNFVKKERLNELFKK